MAARRRGSDQSAGIIWIVATALAIIALVLAAAAAIFSGLSRGPRSVPPTREVERPADTHAATHDPTRQPITGAGRPCHLYRSKRRPPGPRQRRRPPSAILGPDQLPSRCDRSQRRVQDEAALGPLRVTQEARFTLSCGIAVICLAFRFASTAAQARTNGRSVSLYLLREV